MFKIQPMMNILCPTDFSPNSEIAINYAIELSNKAKAKLHIITSFVLPSSAGSFRSLDRHVHDYLNDDLKEFINKVKSNITSGISPEYDALEGAPSTVISSYARHHDIDLIIMGTKGSSSIKNLVIGSTTQKVINQTLVPVLAIPTGTEWHDKSKGQMLLCLDSHGIGNMKSIKFLTELKDILHKNVNVLHVSTQNDQIELSPDTGKLSGIVDNVFDVTGDDVVLEIKNFAKEKATDMIVMIARKHNFWQSIFQESYTEGELFASTLPLLVLPE